MVNYFNTILIRCVKLSVVEKRNVDKREVKSIAPLVQTHEPNLITTGLKETIQPRKKRQRKHKQTSLK